MKKFRVYDDRTNETLFESEDKWEAFMFLADNYDERHEDFAHVWFETIKEDNGDARLAYIANKLFNAKPNESEDLIKALQGETVIPSNNLSDFFKDITSDHAR